MTVLGHLVRGWFTAEALTPVGKWQAAREGVTSAGESAVSDIVSWSIGIGIVLALIAFFLFRRFRKRKAWAALQAETRRYGISDEEFALLAEIVKGARLKVPATVLTAEAAFDRGAAALLESGRFARLGAGEQAKAIELVESLRGKLSFPDPSPVAPGIRSTRSLAKGTQLMVFRGERDQTFQARVTSANAVDIAMQPVPMTFCKAGELLHIQFEDDGQTLEFDTRVVRCRNGKIIVDHSDEVRRCEQRRVPRVDVRLPAKVAPLGPQEDRAPQAAAFRSARVVEVGGTGLKIESPMPVQQGQRVWVDVKLRGKYRLRTAAVVRHVSTGNHKLYVFGVELADFADEEQAKLVWEANQAAAESVAKQVRARQAARKTTISAGSRTGVRG